MKRLIVFIPLLFISFCIAQENNIGVKVGSVGLGYEYGSGNKGNHHGLNCELRYLGGFGTGIKENISPLSSQYANLVKDRHYVNGLRLGGGVINRESPSSHWINYEDDYWINIDETGFWYLFLETFWGYEFHPNKKINPFLTGGVRIGGSFYNVPTEGDSGGFNGDWMVTLPLVAACDLVFYNDMTPGTKGERLNLVFTPFLRADIPVFEAEYRISDATYDGTQLNDWDEELSDWWGTITFGAYLTFNLLFEPTKDADLDGVPDNKDECPNTPITDIVDERGCTIKSRPVDIERELKEKRKFVTNNIQFEYNSAKIQLDTYPILNEIGTIIEQNENWYIEISGHTDSIGSNIYNQDLSERRAQSVRKYLIDNFNISPDRLDSKGYGETQPVPGADNATPEGRALNRRVEFKIIERKK